jgi:hypothetical protein
MMSVSKSELLKVINLAMQLLTVQGTIYTPGHMEAVIIMRTYGV